MRVFNVHAHREPTSFNGAMTREAEAAIAASLPQDGYFMPAVFIAPVATLSA